jgi:hypothetical protein
MKPRKYSGSQNQDEITRQLMPSGDRSLGRTAPSPFGRPTRQKSCQEKSGDRRIKRPPLGRIETLHAFGAGTPQPGYDPQLGRLGFLRRQGTQ